MPVLYPSLSLAESHKHTRTHASLFDVSHMVQHRFTGPGAAAFLETITPIDTSTLDDHRSTLSTLLWDNGGIVDDTIITKLENHVFYVVTNAGCRHKDLEYFKNERAKFESAGGQAVHWEVLEGQGLVALQGPKSQEILESVLADPAGAVLSNLFFGQSRFMRIALPHHHHHVSSPLLVSRGGYTGEDGFEISIPEDETTAVVDELIRASKGALHLAGLGARDSLRLEAGMCLYGHDLDDTITPVEGALSWIIPKSRRDPATATFHGASTILSQLIPKAKGGKGVEKRRIGLIVEGAPAREGAQIVDAEGKEIGKITSGCPSPTLGKNVAMGYVKDGLHKAGTEVGVIVRGKVRKATVSKMPFVPTKYYKA
jgi:aminomethyltransferase